MPSKAYKYAVGYFLLFSILLLISGAVIFFEKIGFSYASIHTYYLGNSANFIAAKTYGGLLKIIVPHIFAFGLFVMVILHFLLFTCKRDTKELQIIIFTSFITAFLELFSPFFIIFGLDFFIVLKLIAYFLFNFVILYALFILFKSIIYD
ncbi:hypothetical protein [Sulfurimonas sp.]